MAQPRNHWLAAGGLREKSANAGDVLQQQRPSVRSLAWPALPLRQMPRVVVKAMKARHVQVMYVRAAGLMCHRRLDLGASRMVPKPGAVALGNQPCASDSWCRAWRRLRKTRSGKGRNEASKNK